MKQMVKNIIKRMNEKFYANRLSSWQAIAAAFCSAAFFDA